MAVVCSPPPFCICFCWAEGSWSATERCQLRIRGRRVVAVVTAAQAPLDGGVPPPLCHVIDWFANVAVNEHRENSLKIESFGAGYSWDIRGPRVGMSWPRPWYVPDQNFMQGAFFCCFRHGMAGMSRNLGRDVSGSEKRYARKLWGDFSVPYWNLDGQIAQNNSQVQLKLPRFARTARPWQSGKPLFFKSCEMDHLSFEILYMREEAGRSGSSEKNKKLVVWSFISFQQIAIKLRKYHPESYRLPLRDVENTEKTSILILKMPIGQSESPCGCPESRPALSCMRCISVHLRKRLALCFMF